MFGWNYFKTISILYGLATVLKGPMIHLFPDRWQRLATEKAHLEGLPRWLWLMVFFGLFLVMYTWYRHFTTDIEHTWVLSVILTIAAIKFAQFFLNCGGLRRPLPDETIESFWRIGITNVIITLSGALLLYLGIFVY